MIVFYMIWFSVFVSATVDLHASVAVVVVVVLYFPDTKVKLQHCIIQTPGLLLVNSGVRKVRSHLWPCRWRSFTADAVNFNPWTSVEVWHVSNRHREKGHIHVHVHMHVQGEFMFPSRSLCFSCWHDSYSTIWACTVAELADSIFPSPIPVCLHFEMKI